MSNENKNSLGKLLLLTGLVAGATFGVVALLVNIFERKQEARTSFVKVVDVSEISSDPAPWGLNFPLQYESYLKSVDSERTQHGGSSALPPSKLDQDPWLKRLYTGYAFAIDYREAHADSSVREVARMFGVPVTTLHDHSSKCLGCYLANCAFCNINVHAILKNVYLKFHLCI